MTENEIKKELRTRLTQSLPPLVARHNIKAYIGDIFSEAYLANLDSQGLGPRKVKFGRKAAYMREDFIEWLLNRMDE